MGYYNDLSIDTRSCGEADEDAALDRRDGLTPPAAHVVHDTSSVAPDLPSSSDAGRRDDPRAIVSIRGGHFRAYWDDHIVGDFDCYHDADDALDDHERELFEQGLLDTPPAIIYARPAEVVEFAPTWIGTPTPDYPCPCLTDPLVAAHADDPDMAAPADATLHASPDALVGAEIALVNYVLAPDTDAAHRNAQARRTGEALMYEFRMDPAAFLTMLDGFSDRARQAVTRATAAYLEEPISEVVGLWSESRARLVALGMLA